MFGYKDKYGLPQLVSKLETAKQFAQSDIIEFKLVSGKPLELTNYTRNQLLQAVSSLIYHTPPKATVQVNAEWIDRARKLLAEM